jgi:hypothetical protein
MRFGWHVVRELTTRMQQRNIALQHKEAIVAPTTHRSDGGTSQRRAAKRQMHLSFHA